MKFLFDKIMKILAAMALLMVASQAIQAQEVDLTGTHVGHVQNSRERAYLLLRNGAEVGRQSSYLGVLMLENPTRIIPYLIDPVLEDNTYGMIPISITEDGEIGITNPDPSLMFNVAPQGKSFSFQVVNANSGNLAGFQGSALFDGTTKGLALVDLVEGIYRVESGNGEMTVSHLNKEGEALVSMSITTPAGNLSGNFVLRRKLPGIYALNAMSMTSRGVKTEKHPRRSVVFIKNGRHIQIYMMNPGVSTGLTILDRK